MEAGRKKGSIKKSREQFRDLIVAIEAASVAQANPQQIQVQRLNKVKQDAKSLQTQLDDALARELSLLTELFDMKKKLAQLTGEKVLPIRKPKRS